MSQDKIQSIKLNKFRGATQPFEIEFDTKKSITMIFGENGTGKSTLIDAMDFIFKEKCGSLKKKSFKSHVPAVGSSSDDVEISISSQNYQWKGKLNGSSPEITRSADNFSIEILRRDRIFKLINAEPKERYEELKDFVELPHIIFSENYLRDCLREIERNINNETSTNQNQKDTLQKSWEGERKPGDNYLKWAEEKSKQQAQELKGKVVKYKKCIDCIEKCFEHWRNFKKLSEEFFTSEKQLKETQNELTELSNKSQPHEIVDILEKTKSFLQKKEPEECPACEQPIESRKLEERISIRLKNIQELTTATKKHKQAENQYNISKRNFVKQREELKNSAKNLIKFLKEEDLDLEIQKITTNIEEYQFLLDENIDLKKAEVLFKDKGFFLQKTQDIYGIDAKTLNQLNLIKTSLQSLKETEQKIQKLSNKKSFLTTVLQVVETERKSYVENILDSISNDVEVLYSKLHPEEGSNNITLFLKPRVQGSLEIKSNFQHKTNIPPQAYFSDSHLDTLGICVFMAMVKLFKNDVIALDDVLTSVDQPHMERFIQMLHDEKKHFNQIIITTHYRPWREEYKFSRKSNSDVDLIELSSFWSVEHGIRSTQTKLSITELEDIKHKNPFDRQIAGSKAGIFMESLLDHLTLLYNLYVPRKPEPIYTLGELINCFSNKFIQKMKIKKNTGNEIPLSNIMKDIFNITEPIRNKVGCHWNNIGQHFSDHQIMLFLEKTIEFGKMLICSQCGGLPNKKKVDCWKCDCEKTSLYPLGR